MKSQCNISVVAAVVNDVIKLLIIQVHNNL